MNKMISSLCWQNKVTEFEKIFLLNLKNNNFTELDKIEKNAGKNFIFLLKKLQKLGFLKLSLEKNNLEYSLTGFGKSILEEFE